MLIFVGPRKPFQEGRAVAVRFACGVGWGGNCKAVSVSGPEQRRGLVEGKRLFMGRCGSRAALQLFASHLPRGV